MNLSTIYDPTPSTLQSMTRVQAIIEVQRITSNVTEATFRLSEGSSTIELAITLKDKLLEALKPIEPSIKVKIDVVDRHRLLVRVDAGKTGKVTLKVKRKPGGIWSRNFD